MPEVDLCSSSAILSPNGWSYAGRHVGQPRLLGIDGRGRPAARVVGLRTAGVFDRRCYLGTRNSFGAFGDSSRILLQDGTSCRLRKAVEDSRIVDFRFETFSDIDCLEEVEQAAELYWSHLEVAAVKRSRDELLLTCRTTPTMPVPCAAAGLTIRQTGWSRYCMVSKAAFCRAFRNDWASAIKTLSEVWAGTGEARGLEWERERAIHALWYLSALRRLEEPTAFFYDTLQHTSCVCAAPPPAPMLDVVRGECAFFAPGTTKILSLSWSDPSWSPVAGGFLLRHR